MVVKNGYYLLQDSNLAKKYIDIQGEILFLNHFKLVNIEKIRKENGR